MLSSLNPQQYDAVTSTNDRTLVLAGAGSGKTRCLTSRAAHLMQNIGHLADDILAVTFTNKAAAEMKSRLIKSKVNVKNLWVGTFHSICVRILRRFGTMLGIPGGFSIYDAEDSIKILKDVLKNYGKFSASDINMIASTISSWKTMLWTAQHIKDKWMADPNGYNEVAVNAYMDYQAMLRKNKALDFDDLIMLTVYGLQRAPAIRQWAHMRFKHILVDEYQDVSHSQYVLIQELLGPGCHLWVCGDPDQGIYGFRGADITCILRFQQDYPNAKLVKLEQNYRSTATIVEAADCVVANNDDRIPKTSYTNNPRGVPIKVMQCQDERDEAAVVSLFARQLHEIEGISYDHMAVLYRTKAQFRPVESALLKAGIPNFVVGGVGFFQRKEIKDLVSYLQLMSNPADRVAFKRVAMLEAGIGDKTIDGFLNTQGDDIIALAQGSNNKKISTFGLWLNDLQHFAAMHKPMELLQQVIQSTGYLQALRQREFDTFEMRKENIDQLIDLVSGYDMITEFLTSASLASATDKEGPGVKLMTIHAAKGLEFQVVFLVGMEDGLLPHGNCAYDQKQLREERRLAYVAMTRAEKLLYLLYARERQLFGKFVHFKPSQFLSELPVTHIQGDIPK